MNHTFKDKPHQRRRWLWWPISFGWATASHTWFQWHGVEETTAHYRDDKATHYRMMEFGELPTLVFSRTWHFGPLKVYFGKKRSCLDR